MSAGKTFYDNFNKQSEFQKIQKFNAAPIKKDIVGDWTLIDSINTDAFLAEKNLGSFHDSVFLAYDQSFLVNHRQFAQLHVIGNEVVGQLHECIGLRTKRRHYNRRTTIQEEGSVLRTMETWYHPNGKFKAFANENRYLKDGLLHVVNENKKMVNGEWESISCTRIYKKVEQFESEGTSNAEFNGTWRPIASSRFEEYCASFSLTGYPRWLLESGHVTLNVLPFFNEFHCKLFLPCTPFEEKYTAQFDEDSNGSITSFKGNQLVTVSHGMEVVRIVKNNKLFHTSFKDGKSFTIVYERI